MIHDSRLSSVLATGSAVALLALTAACGNDEATANAPAPATSSDATHVKRGAATGKSDVDVLVDVAYRGGKADPDGLKVAVRRGARAEVLVSADTHADIDVSGKPDDRADVDPDEAEDVDFTMDRDQVVVSIEGTPLVTFTAS